MKAVLLTKHGGPEMLSFDEVSDPIAGSGDVLVDIYAASVNAADYKVRLGEGDTSSSNFLTSSAETSPVWSAPSAPM